MAIRTDLALEARTLWQESVGKTSELAGVKAREFQLQGLDVTEVQILDEQGAEALQKPVGRYLTLEIENDHRREEAKLNQASEALAQTLGSLLRLERTDQVLVVGLGNPAVTPDALGPKTLNYVLVTRTSSSRCRNSSACSGRSARWRPACWGRPAWRAWRWSAASLNTQRRPM